MEKKSRMNEHNIFCQLVILWTNWFLILWVCIEACISQKYTPDHWHSVQSVCQWSGRPGFRPSSNHTKHSKMRLDASLLNTQHYKVCIKCKSGNAGKGVALSPIPGCCVVGNENESWSGPRLRSTNLLNLHEQNNYTHTERHAHTYIYIYIYIYIYRVTPPGGAPDVMVTVVGNRHGDTSSNPGRDWLNFTSH